MDEINPWTFAGQEALREQRTKDMSFIEKCRIHDELWESIRLFSQANQPPTQNIEAGLGHLKLTNKRTQLLHEHRIRTATMCRPVA